MASDLPKGDRPLPSVVWAILKKLGDLGDRVFGNRPDFAKGYQDSLDEMWIWIAQKFRECLHAWCCFRAEPSGQYHGIVTLLLQVRLKPLDEDRQRFKDGLLEILENAGEFERRLSP